jgi:hypothetical protein
MAGWLRTSRANGAWARVALLRMAQRAGTAATHGHEHDGCRHSSRAGLSMNGRLPAADASYARSAKKQSTAAADAPAGQESAAPPADSSDSVVGALLCYGWG